MIFDFDQIEFGLMFMSTCYKQVLYNKMQI